MKKTVLAFMALSLLLASCRTNSTNDNPQATSIQNEDGYKVVLTGITPLSKSSQDDLPGNADKYSLDSLETLQDSPLKGKTIFWLGSSITYGLCGHGEAAADMVAKHNGCISYKEAASGTTIANVLQPEENGPILTGLIGADPSKEDISFSRRLHNFPLDVKPDLFVLQLSTNDSRLPAETIGKISDSFNTSAFDLATTLGGMEYIIAYVKAHWGCPVMIYTSPFLSNDVQYRDMLDNAYKVAGKWGVYILNLTDDEAFNAIGRENMDLYMAPDEIHPTRAGYRYWWLPQFESRITQILCN